MKLFIAILCALLVANYEVEGMADPDNSVCNCPVEISGLYSGWNGIWTWFWNGDQKVWFKDNMYLIGDARAIWRITSNLSDYTNPEYLLGALGGNYRDKIACPEYLDGSPWNLYPESGVSTLARPQGKCVNATGACPACKTVTGAGALDGKYNLQNSTAMECGDGCLYLGPDNKKYCFDNNGAGDIGACP